MKRLIKGIYISVLCIMPLANAQTGPKWAHLFDRRLLGSGSHHLSLIQTTENQRIDLANCIAQATRVQRIADQMRRIGNHWGRGHIDLSRQDLLDLSEGEQMLNAEIRVLTATHEGLSRTLVEVHDRNLEKRLHKLDRLQTKLLSGSAQVSHDLATARPGPGSPELSWDVNAVTNTASKWRAEHEQIAKYLDLAM